jgi:CubicO group peptidase (beta-lactamase class C family)
VGVPDDTFAARGHDGQYIYVIPSLDLVVVRNGTYAKDPSDPIAEPNLFGKYPSDGLVPGKGTVAPQGGWDDAEFLAPIIQSITGT